ncbi:MAG: glutathione S-transferase family protein [Azoarcus sp.]|jgi:GST-like protein|nr:glutathione S-transferase family protein [Azoarcus sp.]MDD2872642.1 glutathione S-transferase family protein [Azoarcus sp.]MDX9836251.1 glutathione S-transferase family protein [Azoarcus sp.]
MITLHTWGTPNGRKVSIALEELGLDYVVRPVDITREGQFSPEFAVLNPNHKIPVLVDSDGPDGQPFTVIESGAILIYLAEKHAQLLPTDARGRSEAMQWLMFQMGSVGPMLGQVHHFLRFAPDVIPYAIDRYSREGARIYGVLNTRLKGREWLAGNTYSIADIATYPWIARHEWQGIDLARFPEVQRWSNAMSARPAVRRGMEIPK